MPLAIDTLKEVKGDIRQANSKLLQAVNAIVPSVLAAEVQKLGNKQQSEVRAILKH